MLQVLYFFHMKKLFLKKINKMEFEVKYLKKDRNIKIENRFGLICERFKLMVKSSKTYFWWERKVYYTY